MLVIVQTMGYYCAQCVLSWQPCEAWNVDKRSKNANAMFSEPAAENNGTQEEEHGETLTEMLHGNHDVHDKQPVI